MGRFAQEMSNKWVASRKNGFNNVGASRKNGRKKSLIEGGMGIRGAIAAVNAHSSFNE